MHIFCSCGQKIDSSQSWTTLVKTAKGETTITVCSECYGKIKTQSKQTQKREGKIQAKKSIKGVKN